MDEMLEELALLLQLRKEGHASFHCDVVDVNQEPMMMVMYRRQILQTNITLQGVRIEVDDHAAVALKLHNANSKSGGFWWHMARRKA